MCFTVTSNLLYGNNKYLYEIVTKYTYLGLVHICGSQVAATLGGSFGPAGGGGAKAQNGF